MPSQMIVLVNPPQGRSSATEYAERCIHLAENKMKNTVTDLQRRHQRSVSQLDKEKEKLVRDLKKIRNSTGHQEPSLTSRLLEVERKRLKQVLRTVDDYRSDGASSEESSDDRSESDESFDLCDDDDSESRTQHSFRRQSKASYEERSRDERLTNLHRRYSAHVTTEMKRPHKSAS